MLRILYLNRIENILVIQKSNTNQGDLNIHSNTPTSDIKSNLDQEREHEFKDYKVNTLVNVQIFTILFVFLFTNFFFNALC
jgi:hypothetical protein